MSEDANEASEVLLPTTTSGEGIEAAMAGADSSPASEEKHEEKSNGFQQRINDITTKRYEAERKAQELEAENKQLRAAKQKAEASQSVSVEAPKLPDDPYDDQAMRQYHASMVEYSSKVAQEQARAVYEGQQRESEQQKQQQKQQQQLQAYAQNAQRDGVDLQKLQAAEQVLANNGISAELGGFLLEDSNGAKVALHIADNPALMHELLSMSPMQAAVKIANEVKPQALSTTPTLTQAPQPIEEVRGGGVETKDEFDRVYAGYEIL